MGGFDLRVDASGLGRTVSLPSPFEWSESISPKARKYCQLLTISDGRETFPGSFV